MQFPRVASGLVLVPATLALLATEARATTLIRQGLDRLTADNDLVVQGRVLDIHSYWNAEHNFIFTDVRVHPTRVLKGRDEGDVKFTLMGGTVGDVTTLIVDGPELVPGSDYVLFLSPVDLPGPMRRLTIRDIAQGAFDIQGGRVFSQALGHPLLPDTEGRTEAPGGVDGLSLDDLVRQVHSEVNR